jgi:hypothetical protein
MTSGITLSSLPPVISTVDSSLSLEGISNTLPDLARAAGPTFMFVQAAWAASFTSINLGGREAFRFRRKNG